MEKMKFKEGDKVVYVTNYKIVRGIVKSVPDEDNTFVVYHCGDDWDNYRNYTAGLTRNEDLFKGWDL